MYTTCTNINMVKVVTMKSFSTQRFVIHVHKFHNTKISRSVQHNGRQGQALTVYDFNYNFFQQKKLSYEFHNTKIFHNGRQGQGLRAYKF